MGCELAIPLKQAPRAADLLGTGQNAGIVPAPWRRSLCLLALKAEPDIIGVDMGSTLLGSTDRHFKSRVQPQNLALRKHSPDFTPWIAS